MKTKTHWKSAYNSIHLSSSDLNGKEVTLTILSVKREEHRKELCNVAYFEEEGYKPMRLNVGNAKIVKAFAGGSVSLEDWKFPVKVSIFVDPSVRWGRDTVEGLRIRPNKPISVKLTPLTENLFQGAVKFLKEGKTIAQMRTKYSFDAVMEKRLIEGSK